jgi:hypothetical protein
MTLFDRLGREDVLEDLVVIDVREQSEFELRKSGCTVPSERVLSE